MLNFCICYFLYIYLQIKNKMEEADRLGLEEYSSFVLEGISKMIINRNYIEENQDFFNHLLFKLWEDYYLSSVEPISIWKQIKLLEIFLYIMIQEKPTLELPEDSV